MVKLTDEQIHYIADSLEAGLIVYYNKRTNKIDDMPDFDNFIDPDAAGGAWDDLKKDYRENKEDYIVFNPLDSNESFRIMRDFAYDMEDEKFQNKLFDALNMRGPFRNFKYLVDDSDYREDWFKYRHEYYKNHVRVMVDLHNQEYEEEEEE